MREEDKDNSHGPAMWEAHGLAEMSNPKTKAHMEQKTRIKDNDEPPDRRPRLGLPCIVTQDAEEAIRAVNSSSCLLCRSEFTLKVVPVNTAYYGQLFTTICPFCKAQKGWVRMVASVAMNLHTQMVCAARVKTRRLMWLSYVDKLPARPEPRNHRPKTRK